MQRQELAGERVMMLLRRLIASTQRETGAGEPSTS